jgi:hypothetical protein
VELLLGDADIFMALFLPLIDDGRFGLLRGHQWLSCGIVTSVQTETEPLAGH